MGCGGGNKEKNTNKDGNTGKSTENGRKTDPGDHSTESQERILKLVCVGDNNIGKTAFFTRFVDKKFNAKDTTIPPEQRNMKYKIKDTEYELELLDTCGQERFRTITTTFYGGASGAFISFDLTNSGSFENVNQWLKEISSFGSPTLLKVLVGLKSDLKHVVTSEEAEEYAGLKGMKYFECSSATGEGLEDGIRQFLEDIVKRR